MSDDGSRASPLRCGGSYEPCRAWGIGHQEVAAYRSPRPHPFWAGRRGNLGGPVSPACGGPPQAGLLLTARLETAANNSTQVHRGDELLHHYLGHDPPPSGLWSG